MGRIPENILDDILSRVDIVEVISAYIPLKRTGRNFKCCCPFHHEKTPSFIVSPDRQIYHCFGCGESGNAFKFLMRHERLDFPEAVEALARKTGVVIPKPDNFDQKAASLTAQLFKLNELTALFYEDHLYSQAGSRAQEYLSKRGISKETAKLFKLGLAPDRWDALFNSLRAKSLPIALVEKAGLILAKEGGGYYDRFRNRIIFPIIDLKSRALGFGARVLDDSLPKYINSPETPIYTKGNNLYGLNIAKEAIRESDFAVVVEGYLDLIVPFQHGLKNIVASLGTALTQEQVRLLKRYTMNVVMVYDPDNAGQIATLRSLEIFIEEDMSVKVVSLAAGFDPDLFVRKNGIEKFREKISSALGLFDYKLKILKARYNPKEIEGKAKIASEMLQTLNKFKNTLLFSEYIKRLAEELVIREDALLSEAKRIKTNKPFEVAAREVTTRKALNINPTERLLIKLMLEENEFIGRIKKSLEPADFQDARASRLVSVIFDLIDQGRKIGPNLLISHLQEEEDLSQIICESTILTEDFSFEHKEKMLDDCIRRLKNERIRQRKQDLHDQISHAQDEGDEEKLKSLMEEFHYLTRQDSVKQ